MEKLFKLHYLKKQNKTQIIYPELLGELIYEAVANSISQLLNPTLTASWEKGLTYVANGEINEEEYLQKLNVFISKRTDGVKNLKNSYELENAYRKIAKYYTKGSKNNEG